MDRFEKHAEYIMERGDRILAEKANKAKMIKRFSLSGAGVIAAAIVGIFTLHSAPSAPERIPVVSEVISTTSGYVSDTVTTVPTTAQTKAAKTTVATTPTTVKAKEVKTNISRSEMTAADTTLQTTQTMAVAPVVQSEVISTLLQPESTSTVLSGIVTIPQSEHTQSVSMLTTDADTTILTIDTAVSSMAISTDNSLSSFSSTNITMISDNLTSTTTTISQNIFDSTTYDLKNIRISKLKADNFLGTTLTMINNEMREGRAFSIKGISKECAVMISYDDQKYYLYTNNNYLPSNLGQLLDDTSLKQEALIKNIILYNNEIFSIYTEDYSTLICDMLSSISDSDYIENEHLPATLTSKVEIIMDIPIFGLYETKVTIYTQGILKIELSEDIYFNIDETNVEKFTKCIDKFYRRG
ncbi:MAG TPA: hypothetical protein PLH98_01420 [Ruminococcus flavefaciens]|nr:hypothetical protein [Ruminococcus flavefaciens]